MGDMTPEQRAEEILPPDIFHESPSVEMREAITDAIRSAVLAERERCAGIAGSMRRPIDALYSSVDECNAYNAGVNAAEDAIRAAGERESDHG